MVVYTRPEKFRRSLPRERVAVESYAGGPDSLAHHVRQWPVRHHYADLAGLFPKVMPTFDSLLEAGCGMGHLSEHLGIPKGRYTGLDLNGAFLAEGRRRYPGIRLLQGSVDRLPFPPDRFDAVLCSDVLIHLEDMRAGLKEIVRVCSGVVLLRLRTGDASVRGNVVYDPDRGRLFSRVNVGGVWRYFFYNVLALEDLDALLSEAGVSRYSLYDINSGGEFSLAKVVFNTKQSPER